MSERGPMEPIHAGLKAFAQERSILQMEEGFGNLHEILKHAARHSGRPWHQRAVRWYRFARWCQLPPITAAALAFQITNTAADIPSEATLRSVGVSPWAQAIVRVVEGNREPV